MTIPFTTWRGIALVMTGFCLVITNAQANNSQAPDSVVAVTSEARPFTHTDDEPPMKLISITDDSDAMVNLFDLAKELDEAIQARQPQPNIKSNENIRTAQQSEQTPAKAPLNISNQPPRDAEQAKITEQTKPPLFLALNQTDATAQRLTDAIQQQTTQSFTPNTSQNMPQIEPQSPVDNYFLQAQTQQQVLPPALQAQRQQETQQTQAQPELTEAEMIAKIKADTDQAEQAYIQRMRERAFDQVQLEAFPMTPDQIIEMRHNLDKTQRAQEVYPGTPPKPVSTSLIVNLSPGTTPPVIRLGKGFVSSLVFVDATGAPWKILSYDVGAPDIFNVQWDKESNMLLIQSNKPYSYGNIAVNLVGLNTPVMLTLLPGQREIDYRVDLRVQALGPNPNTHLLDDGMPANADKVLLNFLNGAAPDIAKPLLVHGSHTQAWSMKNRLYVRSRFKVISPSWLASMTSADGTHVYELPKTPVLLLSRHGKVVSMQLEGF